MTALRGKYAEGHIRAQLKKLADSRSDLDFDRLQDAHSARGHFSTPQAGDFLVIHKGVPFYLEVKEVAHDYRLPVGNFGLDQRARMRKKVLAGAKAIVLVYFSNLKVWRVAGLDYFGLQSTGSWDMRDIEPAARLNLEEHI